MKSIIQADLFKIRKSRMVKVLMSISFVSAVILMVMSHLFAAGELELGSAVQFASFFSDPQMIALLGCITAGMLLSTDFENKAIEHAVAGGKSRLSIIMSKLTVFSLIIFLLLLPYLALSAIGGVMDTDFMAFLAAPLLNLMANTKAVTGEAIGKMLFLLLTLAIQSIAQLSIALPVVFALKRPVFVVSCTYFLILLLGPLASLNEKISDVMKFTPFGFDIAELSLQGDIGTMAGYIGISAVFIAVMGLAAYMLFRRADVK